MNFESTRIIMRLRDCWSCTLEQQEMIGVMGVVAEASLVRELRQKYVLRVFKAHSNQDDVYICWHVWSLSIVSPVLCWSRPLAPLRKGVQWGDFPTRWKHKRVVTGQCAVAAWSKCQDAASSMEKVIANAYTKAAKWNLFFCWSKNKSDFHGTVPHQKNKWEYMRILCLYKPESSWTKYISPCVVFVVIIGKVLLHSPLSFQLFEELRIVPPAGKPMDRGKMGLGIHFLWFLVHDCSWMKWILMNVWLTLPLLTCF